MLIWDSAPGSPSGDHIWPFDLVGGIHVDAGVTTVRLLGEISGAEVSGQNIVVAKRVIMIHKLHDPCMGLF